MTRAILCGAALMAACCLSACQTTGNGRALAETHATPAESSHAIAIGRSSKLDVEREWGAASVQKFPSGYEVWVYQETAGLPKILNYVPGVQLLTPNFEKRTREKALLFDPNGILRKMELRNGQATGAG